MKRTVATAADVALLDGRSYAAIKLALPAAVLFLALLLILGVLGVGTEVSHASESCGDRGESGADSGQASDESNREEQIENAQIIDQVAQENGLSGQATLIALMAALQESSLLNLDYGDRDSLGLFQQRPSQGWGTEEQIMDPEYSADMFFMGDEDGSPAGLTDVEGWETMEPGDAAQAVQRSAYPDLYAGQESAARSIAEEAGIDLDREGENTGSGATADSVADEGECYTGDDSGQAGQEFTDASDEAWPSEVDNPRSTQAAITWARNQAENGGKDWYGMCLSFVAQAYGWSYSGVTYAIDHYYEMPSEMQHDGDRTVPVGALMYWETGSRAGHVALYVGDGMVASNDIERAGYIDIVDATAIETEWGATYVGWAPPYFPKGG